MNWEVWTMKSRISCCNAGLLRRSILRGAPLWGLWTLGGLLLLPLHLLSLFRVDSRETTEYLLGITQVGTVLVFGYGLLVAWYLFAYLYNTRTAYHYGSLPLRRETQFLTRYLAGLLFHLVPAAVIALLTILVTALQGANCLAASGTFFAATSPGLPLLLQPGRAHRPAGGPYCRAAGALCGAELHQRGGGNHPRRCHPYLHLRHGLRSEPLARLALPAFLLPPEEPLRL